LANHITVFWQRDPARVAGLFYLILTILVFLGAIRFLIVPGEIITPNIILIARFGFVVDLFGIMFFLLLGWALFVLFSPVNRNLALLVTLSISVSVAIQALNTLNYFAALSVLSGADYMIVFDADQLQALATFYLELHMDTTHIAEFFWFLWVFSAGYLIFKSDILPKSLGILLMVGGIGYLLVIFGFFLFPSLGVVSALGGVLGGFAEISLMVWLLVRGAKIPSTGADKESKEE